MSYTLRVLYGMHGTQKDAKFLLPHIAWADVFAPELTYVEENLEDMWNDISFGDSTGYLSCVSHPFFAELVRMTAGREKFIWLCDYFDDETISKEFKVLLERYASVGTIIVKRYDAADCARRVRAIHTAYVKWQSQREESFVDQLVARLERLPPNHHTNVLVFFGLGHARTLSEKLRRRGVSHETYIDSAKAKLFANRGNNKYGSSWFDLAEYEERLSVDTELIRLVLTAATYHLGYTSKTRFRLRRRIAHMSSEEVFAAYETIRRSQIGVGFQNYFRLAP